jgi:hypothetical protein
LPVAVGTPAAGIRAALVPEFGTSSSTSSWAGEVSWVWSTLLGEVGEPDAVRLVVPLLISFEIVAFADAVEAAAGRVAVAAISASAAAAATATITSPDTFRVIDTLPLVWA